MGSQHFSVHSSLCWPITIYLRSAALVWHLLAKAYHCQSEGWFTQAKTMLYFWDPNFRHVQVLARGLSTYRFGNKSGGEKDKNIFSRHDGVCLEFNIKNLNEVHYFMSTPTYS
jgi:hypothetical protein